MMVFRRIRRAVRSLGVAALLALSIGINPLVHLNAHADIVLDRGGGSVANATSLLPN